jgi:XTP/dITP diphosphohydrolase
MIEELVIATTNRGKVKEIKSLLLAEINNIYSINDFDNIPKIEESGSTFEENALIKARVVADITNKHTISDDSGLEVISLDNRPGIYSARYAGEDATDADNIDKLLYDMKGIENRAARFVCCIALVSPDGNEKIFRGICNGEILEAKKGEGGFGYDPVFYFPGANKTFAQLSTAEKNKFSHRAKATKQLNNYLLTL